MAEGQAAAVDRGEPGRRGAAGGDEAVMGGDGSAEADLAGRDPRGRRRVRLPDDAGRHRAREGVRGADGFFLFKH